jgi:anti-sigma factor RsiW
MRLALRLRHRDLVCQQAVELVTDYLEDELTAGARRRLERHLAVCPHCTEYLAQMRATIALAGRITPDDLTPQMRTEFTDLFRRWQADGGAGLPDEPDGPAGPGGPGAPDDSR